jgi:molybdopterin-guanine dinucleotide biosynthesis protein A
VPVSRARAHPVFGLWPVRLREDLCRAVVDDEIRKVDLWTGRHRLMTVPFADIRPTRFSTLTGPRILTPPLRY